MKNIEMKNGQILEIFKNLKEIKKMIMDSYINNKDYLDEDSSLYIQYKDGSKYYLCGAEECGKFKKTGIKTVIENNSSTYQVYGKYVLSKIDEKEDDNNCTWIVEAI